MQTIRRRTHDQVERTRENTRAQEEEAVGRDGESDHQEGVQKDDSEEQTAVEGHGKRRYFNVPFHPQSAQKRSVFYCVFVEIFVVQLD